mmetsp:Transcript_28688/g.82777  ORF Transcript_28688/g.82777 Transcript_28688/m.82777 type:complete len:205 (-) Transcript_28688:827-1441(-)
MNPLPIRRGTPSYVYHTRPTAHTVRINGKKVCTSGEQKIVDSQSLPPYHEQTHPHTHTRPHVDVHTGKDRRNTHTETDRQTDRRTGRQFKNTHTTPHTFSDTAHTGTCPPPRPPAQLGHSQTAAHRQAPSKALPQTRSHTWATFIVASKCQAAGIETWRWRVRAVVCSACGARGRGGRKGVCVLCRVSDWLSQWSGLVAEPPLQ